MLKTNLCKIILVVFFTCIVFSVPSATMLTQVQLPTNGALDDLRKENFAVDILSWVIAILAGVIIWQETQKRNKDKKVDEIRKEMSDLKDNQLKELQQKIMRYESKS